MSANAATYYDILRVSRHAAPEGVRSAYRALAQRYHPDKLPGNANAVQVMAALNEAYAVLSDPERRAHYDRSLVASRVVRRPVAPPVREAAWPWWLIFGTAAFAFTTLGTVAYRVVFPSVTPPSPAAVQPAPPTRVARK